MRQRIGRRNRRQRQRSANGLLQPSRIAKGPYQSVMRLDPRRGHIPSLRLAKIDCRTKCLRGLGS